MHERMGPQALNDSGELAEAATVLLNQPRLLCAVRAWLRDATASLGAFEWVSLGYLGVFNLLIVIFHRNLPGAWLYYARHIAVGGALVSLCWAAQRWRHPALQFSRDWYPNALFLFCFEELHYLVHLIFPGWFDSWLIQFDKWLVGTHPTVWLQQFARPWLNDFMQFAYMTYFFYLIVLGGMLYARGERAAYWAVVISTAVAYYLGYLTSVLFPVESPYHSLARLHTVELTGAFFTALINWIESFGRVHGGAFPSAHVSGSFVALLGAWRYRRWLFWVFLPFFLAMLVSTVYGRYHHVADVLAGLVVGAVGFRIGHRLVRFPAKATS